MSNPLSGEDEEISRTALLNCIRKASSPEQRKSFLIILENVVAQRTGIPMLLGDFYNTVNTNVFEIQKILCHEIDQLKMDQLKMEVSSLLEDSPPQENGIIGKMVSTNDVPLEHLMDTESSDDDNDEFIDLTELIKNDLNLEEHKPPVEEPIPLWSLPPQDPPQTRDPVHSAVSDDPTPVLIPTAPVTHFTLVTGDTSLPTTQGTLEANPSLTQIPGEPVPATRIPGESAHPVTTAELSSRMTWLPGNSVPPVTRVPGDSPMIRIPGDLSSTMTRIPGDPLHPTPPVTTTRVPGEATPPSIPRLPGEPVMVRPRGFLPPPPPGPVTGAPLGLASGAPPGLATGSPTGAPPGLATGSPTGAPPGLTTPPLSGDGAPEYTALPKSESLNFWKNRQSSVDSYRQSSVEDVSVGIERSKSSSGDSGDLVEITNHNTHKGNTVYRSKKLTHDQLTAFFENNALRSELRELGACYLISPGQDTHSYNISFSGTKVITGKAMELLCAATPESQCLYVREELPVPLYPELRESGYLLTFIRKLFSRVEIQLEVGQQEIVYKLGGNKGDVLDVVSLLRFMTTLPDKKYGMLLKLHPRLTASQELVDRLINSAQQITKSTVQFLDCTKTENAKFLFVPGLCGAEKQYKLQKHLNVLVEKLQRMDTETQEKDGARVSKSDFIKYTIEEMMVIKEQIKVPHSALLGQHCTAVRLISEVA